MKRYHYQMYCGGPWVSEAGYSLANIMPWISATEQAVPYCHFVTEY